MDKLTFTVGADSVTAVYTDVGGKQTTFTFTGGAKFVAGAKPAIESVSEAGGILYFLGDVIRYGRTRDVPGPDGVRNPSFKISKELGEELRAYINARGGTPVSESFELPANLAAPKQETFEITADSVTYTSPRGEPLTVTLPDGGLYMKGDGVVGIGSIEKSYGMNNTSPFAPNPQNFISFSLDPTTKVMLARRQTSNKQGKKPGRTEHLLPPALLESVRKYIQTKLGGNNVVEITGKVIFKGPDFKPIENREQRLMERGEAALVAVAEGLPQGALLKFLGGKGHKTYRKARKARKTRKSKPSVRRRGY